MRLKSPAAQPAGADRAPGDLPTPYRTLASLVSGGVMVLFGAGLAVGLLFGNESHPVGIAVGLLLAVLGVIGALYPVTRTYPDRVVVRNPFRTIEIPWPRVDEITAKLSLEIKTKAGEGADGAPARKFTVWSIPVSMHERRKADRAVTKQMRGARNDAMRQARDEYNTEALLHGGRGSGAMRGKQGVAAIELMSFADQAVSEMEDRRRVCDTPVEDSAPVHVSWTWWTLVLFTGAIALLLVGLTGVL